MSHKNEPHIRLNRAMLVSEAYLSLPDAALRLLVDLRFLLTGHNNGMLAVTLNVLKRRGWNSSDKLVRALRELEQRGIIVCTKRMHANPQHEPSRYAFTDLPIPAHPAHGIAGRDRTDAYKQWTEKSAFREAEGAPSARRKASLPSDGKRPSKTLPPDGKRQNGELPSNVSEMEQLSEKTARLPSHGKEILDIAIRTRPATDNSNRQVGRVAAMNDSEYRAALASAVDERERARLRYERRCRNPKRATCE